MSGKISHSWSDETLEAKARWFQSLSLSERMDMLCFFTDMILQNNPKITEVDLEDVKLLQLQDKGKLPTD